MLTEILSGSPLLDDEPPAHDDSAMWLAGFAVGRRAAYSMWDAGTPSPPPYHLVYGIRSSAEMGVGRVLDGPPGFLGSEAALAPAAERGCLSPLWL